MPYCVMIVDDEKMPRDILRDHLPWKEMGVEDVLTAEDGAGALELAKKHRPDIIISDVKMPRMNGMELARQVRTLLPDCQFVFLSGYSDKEYLKDAIKLKAASYVEKPIDMEEIEGVLREVLGVLRAVHADPRILFFRGDAEDASPLGEAVYVREPKKMRRLEESIKQKKQSETMLLLAELHDAMRGCEATDPSYIRQVYCQIVFMLLRAAEAHAVANVLSQSDYLLYTAVKEDTLAQLWMRLENAAAAYFHAIESNVPDPMTCIGHYLEKHWADPDLTLTGMAQAIGFNNAYLCTAYKKASGQTILQHITDMRMENAKALLAGTNCKMYEIALQVGYTDAKYFTRLFSREVGLAPKEYRERHRNET